MKKFAKKLLNGFVDYQRRRACRHILMSMSARELEDIGITYGDIDNVVKGIHVRRNG